MNYDMDKLRDSIKKNEGFRAQAYQDSMGLWTIGYGRLCDKSRPNSGLTEAEAEYLLTNDIARIEASLTSAIPWMKSLSDARQRVLIEMAFQLGVSGTTAFRQALKAMQAGDWQTAHDQMLDSRWARQTPARAKELAAHMLRG